MQDHIQNTPLPDDLDSQYSLLKILTIRAIVAVPMPILAFIVGPMLAPEGTWQLMVGIWLLLIGGMIWQFIVSVAILYRELDEFTWPAIKERIWLQAPQDPKTGKTNYKLFWWLIPAFLAFELFEATPIATIIGESILIPFPWLASLPYIATQSLLVPELVGAWWLLPIVFVSCVFNYLLGGRVAVSRHPVAQNAWCIWQMGLGGQWRSVCPLPYALPNPHVGDYSRHHGLDAAIAPVPKYLVRYHPAQL